MYHKIEIITETEVLVYIYASQQVADNGGEWESIQSHPLPADVEAWAVQNGFQAGDNGYFKVV